MLCENKHNWMDRHYILTKKKKMKGFPSEKSIALEEINKLDLAIGMVARC